MEQLHKFFGPIVRSVQSVTGARDSEDALQSHSQSSPLISPASDKSSKRPASHDPGHSSSNKRRRILWNEEGKEHMTEDIIDLDEDESQRQPRRPRSEQHTPRSSTTSATGNTMSGKRKPPGSGHAFRNTLSSSHSSNKKTYSQQSGRRFQYGLLPLDGIKGDNVTQHRRPDTNHEMEGPVTKKPRISSATTNRSDSRTNWIDADDKFFEREPVSAKQQLQSSRLSLVSGQSNLRNPSQPSETFRKQERDMSFPFSKRPNKARVSTTPRHKNLESDDEVMIHEKQSTPRSSTRLQKQKLGTEEQPLELEEDEVSRKVSKEKRLPTSNNVDRKSIPIEDHNGEVKIIIPRVEDEIRSISVPEKSHSKLGGQSAESDMSRTNQEMKKGNRKASHSSGISSHDLPTRTRIPNRNTRSRSPELRSTCVFSDRTLQQSHASNPPFVVSSATPKRPPPKSGSPRFRDRMDESAASMGPPLKQQATQRVAGRRTPAAEDQSEDELNGPTTVCQPVDMPGAGKSKSNGVSDDNPVSSMQEVDASDGDSESETEQGAIKSRHFTNKSSDKGTFIPVARMFTKALYIEDGTSIRFYYPPDKRRFEVMLDDEDGSNTFQQKVLYDPGHMRSIIVSEDADDTRLIATGKMDEISSGRLYFDFSDIKARNFFTAAINSASKSTVIPTTSPSAKFHKFFQNGCAELARVHGPHSEAPSTLPSSKDASHADKMAETKQAKPSVHPPAKRTARKILNKPASARVEIQAEPEITRYMSQNKITPWEIPLTYPFTGAKRTTVNFEDLDRLDDGDFLNDNIVNFCLRRLEDLHPDLSTKVYFFNTYLYSSLSKTSSGRKGFNYDAVKRWTRKTDLFGYPYIVVPVNVDFHWFVAIICNLQHLSRAGLATDDEETVEDSGAHANDGGPMQGSEGPTITSRGATPSQQLEEMSLDESKDDTTSTPQSCAKPLTQEIPDSDEERKQQKAYEADLLVEVDGIPPSTTSTPARKSKKKLPPPRRFDPNQPLIITLDSLGGAHSSEVRYLKDYVVAEGKDKRAMELAVTDIKGITAKGIPEQTNFCDCGVYVIGYIEEFLKNPRRFVEKVCSKELDRNNDFQDFDASKKRREIRTVLMDLAEEQKLERRKARTERALAKRNAIEKTDPEHKTASVPPSETPQLPVVSEQTESTSHHDDVTDIIMQTGEDVMQQALSLDGIVEAGMQADDKVVDISEDKDDPPSVSEGIEDFTQE